MKLVTIVLLAFTLSCECERYTRIFDRVQCGWVKNSVCLCVREPGYNTSAMVVVPDKVCGR